MSSKKRRIPTYKLGFRKALYSTIPIGIFTWVLVFVYLGSSTVEGVVVTAAMIFLSFLTFFVIDYRVDYKRLMMLERISKNISKKRFEEMDDQTSSSNDELDYVIKKLVKSNRTVEREIQRLNRIENYRKEFIGDISHELKTPIFAIQGFVETLLNGALEDEKVNRKFLQKAMRNVNRLIYLTKDLMEISKLETGELKSEMEEIYLFDIINEVVESLQYKAQQEQVNLFIERIDRNLRIRADKNQLRQVLINLVENGIKYNVPQGSVRIEIIPTKRADKMILNIEDTGIGIDEADLPRVTERFFRVDKSRSRERGGTGLGLAIVKHIIEAHGETLKIKSEPNKGSKFSISLTRVDVDENSHSIDNETFSEIRRGK
jgi:two-component system, OmpR family, phosphate regulon sensor histidine kinase PhoR